MSKNISGPHVGGNADVGRDYAGKDSVDADVGDHTDNANIGLNNKQFVQYFGNVDSNTSKEDLASLLSLALFGNDKIDFVGVINEIRQLKITIRRIQDRLEPLQTGQRQRELDSESMHEHIALLESDLKSLRVEFSNMKNELTAVLKARTLNLFHVVLYSIIILGSLSSVYILFR